MSPVYSFHNLDTVTQYYIQTHTCTHTHTQRLLKLMREMFGPQNVNWSCEDQSKIEICVDSNKALLDPATMAMVVGALQLP